MYIQFIKLNENPEWIEKAATWFHEKWGVPKEAYMESMEQSINNFGKIPHWYIVLDMQNRIAAGVGVIENDFHTRRDLTPNICALYVEPEYRGQGIAKFLLDVCRREAGHLDFTRIYLVTEHTEFYEKCGWKFLMTVSSDDNEELRMYVAEAC